MMSSDKYLIFANQADMFALTAVDPVLKLHFVQMAEQWRRRAGYAAATEIASPETPPAG